MRIFENFVDRIDLFELSQSTNKNLFWSNFLCRSLNFEKQASKGVFRHFLENLDRKNFVFLARAPPLK